MEFLDFFKKIADKDTWEKKDKPVTGIKAKHGLVMPGGIKAKHGLVMPGAGHYEAMQKIVPGTNMTWRQFYDQKKAKPVIKGQEGYWGNQDNNWISSNKNQGESRNPVAASMPVPVSAVPAVAKVGSGFIDDLKVIASRKYAPNLLGRGVSYGYIRKHGASQAGAGVFSQSRSFLDRVAATKEKLKDTGSDAYKSWEEAKEKNKGKYTNKFKEMQASPGNKYKFPTPVASTIAPVPTAAPTGSGVGWDWKRGITY